MLPTLRHPGKGLTLETVKWLWLPGMKRQRKKDLYASEEILYDNTMVRRCHYILIKSSRMHNIESEPWYQRWALGDGIVRAQWGACAREWGGGKCKILVLSTQFFC